MTPLDGLYERHCEMARKIQQEARNNPESPYKGKFIGVANGQIAVVADNLDELVPRLAQIESDNSKIMIIEADDDIDAVHEIWLPPMDPFNGLYQRHCEMARKIQEEARNNPDSPYKGKFVGFADGQIAVVADTADEALERLSQIDLDNSKLFMFEVDADFDTANEIWDLS